MLPSPRQLFPSIPFTPVSSTPPPSSTARKYALPYTLESSSSTLEPVNTSTNSSSFPSPYPTSQPSGFIPQQWSKQQSNSLPVNMRTQQVIETEMPQRHLTSTNAATRALQHAHRQQHPDQIPPHAPAPGSLTLDDYMIAMESKFLLSQDKYFDKAVRDVEKTIQNIHDDIDNELNLALSEEKAVIEETVYRAKLFLEYVMNDAARTCEEEILASEALFQSESESLKSTMLTELHSRRKKLDSERVQDVFEMNLDTSESPGRISRHQSRKHSKRINEEVAVVGVPGRKKAIKVSNQAIQFKLPEDEIQKDLAEFHNFGYMPQFSKGRLVQSSSSRRK